MYNFKGKFELLHMLPRLQGDYPTVMSDMYPILLPKCRACRFRIVHVNSTIDCLTVVFLSCLLNV